MITKSTKLWEFNNQNGKLLRGIFVTGDNTDADHIVIMMGGFERTATTEEKFKTLADELIAKNVSSLRFDTEDCGLSDGDFYNMNVQTLADDLMSAINLAGNQGYKKVSVVGHSLAACAISLILDRTNLEKIVLIAPALNQRELLRLWFAQQINKGINITWENYKSYLNENDFLSDIKSDLTTKTHRLNFKYRHDNQNMDYSEKFNKISGDNVLWVHGKKDDKVPMESINVKFKNKIIVLAGDHDLENPTAMEQWTDGVVDFLSSNI